MLALAITQAIPATAAEPAPADVVATVGEKPILRGDVDTVLRIQAAAQGGGQSANPAPAAWAAVLEQLVDQEIIRTEIDRTGLTIARADIEAGVTRLRAQIESRGVTWQEFLGRTGRTEESIREQMSLELGMERLIRPRLDEARLTEGFEKYRREIDGTRVRVRHIVIRPDAGIGDSAIDKAKDRAEAIRREILRNDISFADAARRYSVGPSRHRGGDIGWITRQGMCVDEFARRSFRLAKGEVSKPFVTPFGMHIVEVSEVQPGTLPIDAVRPQLESLLAADMLREIVTRGRADTPISYAAGVPYFDPATPADSGLPRRVLTGPSPAGR